MEAENSTVVVAASMAVADLTAAGMVAAVDTKT